MSSSITPLQRVGGDQTQVDAAGRRTVRLRLELVTSPVQIDLAVAEGKGGTSRAEVTACMPSTRV